MNIRQSRQADDSISAVSDGIEKVKIGIIGAARIAHKFVKSAERLPEVKVVSVVSKSAERAAAFAAETEIPAFYGSYEEMLQKEPLDAVYVATTMNFHYENTICCDAGTDEPLCDAPAEPDLYRCHTGEKDHGDCRNEESAWLRDPEPDRDKAEYDAEGKTSEGRDQKQ